MQAFLAVNLRRARKAAEMTQERLAELASIDVTYVQQVERGDANLTIRTLDRLATVLGVQAFELLKPVKAVPVRNPGRPRKRASAPEGAPSKKRRPRADDE